jgi:hypothetical protein
MIYIVRNIADFCDVDFGFIRRILESNEMRPSVIYGNANEKNGYTFYQLFLLRHSIEQLVQKNVFFENEEIFLIKESKLNYENN